MHQSSGKFSYTLYCFDSIFLQVSCRTGLCWWNEWINAFFDTFIVLDNNSSTASFIWSSQINTKTRRTFFHFLFLDTCFPRWNFQFFILLSHLVSKYLNLFSPFVSHLKKEFWTERWRTSAWVYFAWIMCSSFDHSFQLRVWQSPFFVLDVVYVIHLRCPYTYLLQWEWSILLCMSICCEWKFTLTWIMYMGLICGNVKSFSTFAVNSHRVEKNFWYFLRNNHIYNGLIYWIILGMHWTSFIHIQDHNETNFCHLY